MITIKDLMFAVKLKALRAKKNVKQLYAADLLGVDCQQHYSDYESGKKHFSEEIIKKISIGFEIPVAEFKKVDYEILNNMIREADLGAELQTYVKRSSNREHYLYLLECEKRLIEIKLEKAKENRALLDQAPPRRWTSLNDVPQIYVMA